MYTNIYVYENLHTYVRVCTRVHAYSQTLTVCRLNVKKEHTFFKYWSAVFSIFRDMVDDEDQDNAYVLYVELALQRSKDWMSSVLLTSPCLLTRGGGGKRVTFTFKHNPDTSHTHTHTRTHTHTHTHTHTQTYTHMFGEREGEREGLGQD